jgi:hypothetical protein
MLVLLENIKQALGALSNNLVMFHGKDLLTDRVWAIQLALTPRVLLNALSLLKMAAAPFKLPVRPISQHDRFTP